MPPREVATKIRQRFTVPPPPSNYSNMLSPLQVTIKYAKDQTSLIITTNLKNLDDILQTGISIKDQVNQTQTYKKLLKTNPLTTKLDKTIDLLLEQKQKTATVLHTLHSRRTRHLLTPLISSITGLASAKTVSQLHSILSKIDLRSQRNHLRSDEILLNQQKLTESLDDTINLVNEMRNSIITHQSSLRKP